jgi:hypothetical protein
MQNVNLHRTMILAAAIAIGSASLTIDAFARGVGGGGGSHGAKSGGVASGHASAAPRGTPAGGASHAHTIDGSAAMRVGHAFVPE